jgi:hypothetical protein
VAEPYSVDTRVEAVPLGLVVETTSVPATITLIAEPGSVILAVSGPGFAHDYRLPLWAMQHLEERGAIKRAEAEALALADTP